MTNFPHRSHLLRFLGVALATLFSLALGCASGGRVPLPGDLRVGIQSDYPPLAFKQGTEIVGIEADLAQKTADALGRRLRLVELDRTELIPALEAGDIDVIMAGMSVTRERMERVRFIEPYAPVGQMALLRRDDLARLGRLVSLRRPGVRVGFVRGTTGEQYVRGVLTQADARSFESVDDGEKALRAGTIDYFIHDAPTVWRLSMSPTDNDLIGLYKPLTSEQLAWAVRPDDGELGSQLDALVLKWKADGEIDTVLNKWVPVRVTQSN